MSEYIIRMVGDDLIHKQLNDAAFDGENYNFDKMFEGVKDLVQESDLAIINQETVLVNDRKKISSFPSFGSPAELADSIVRAGFRAVLHASNHSLDKGYAGIEDTLSIWKKYPKTAVLGIHTSSEDARKLKILRVGEMNVALINLSGPMNYHPMPLGKPYAVDRMRNKDKKRIHAQIARAKRKADLVIVLPHWGIEYLYEPVVSQKKWAQFFAECGADLIIGTHPHVLQYKEAIKTSDGRVVPCIYSLGNFISCQVTPGTFLGGMADIRVVFSQTSNIRRAEIKKTDIIPLVTHTDSEYSYFTTYPLDNYTDELSAENKIFTVIQKQNGGERIDVAEIRKLYNDIMNRKAMAYAKYKKPSDVTISNIKGVFDAILGRNTKD